MSARPPQPISPSSSFGRQVARVDFIDILERAEDLGTRGEPVLCQLSLVPCYAPLLAVAGRDAHPKAAPPKRARATEAITWSAGASKGCLLLVEFKCWSRACSWPLGFMGRNRAAPSATLRRRRCRFERPAALGGGPGQLRVGAAAAENHPPAVTRSPQTNGAHPSGGPG